MASKHRIVERGNVIGGLVDELVAKIRDDYEGGLIKQGEGLIISVRFDPNGVGYNTEAHVQLTDRVLRVDGNQYAKEEFITPEDWECVLSLPWTESQGRVLRAIQFRQAQEQSYLGGSLEVPDPNSSTGAAKANHSPSDDEVCQVVEGINEVLNKYGCSYRLWTPDHVSTPKQRLYAMVRVFAS
jgi:hypothetical protein